MSVKILSQPKHPNAIDINTGNLKYALKEFTKQEQRIKYGLCFKYKSNTYLLSHCSILLP